MNIKNAKDHLARARGHISSAVAWLEQEETKKKKELWLIPETRLREIIREEIKEYMKKWIEKNIYKI